MYFVLYAIGLIGICYLGASWLTLYSNDAADEPAKPPRQDWKPRSHWHAENGDALDWTVTVLVLVCYASANWMLLKQHPHLYDADGILRWFALPIPLAVFAVALTVQINMGRPSWAGLIVITLGLLASGAFNFLLLMAIMSA